MSESTTSLNSVSDKVTEHDSSCSSLSLANDKQIIRPISETNQSTNLNDNNSDSTVIVRTQSSDQENSLNSSRSSKYGSWTLVEAREFSDKYIPEENQSGKDRGDGQYVQGQSHSLNIARNRTDSDGKQRKLMSTFSNLKKITFGKRQNSEPGSTNSKLTADTVFCTRCKMVSLILYILHVVSSADNLCKQFGPRSGPTFCRA